MKVFLCVSALFLQADAKVWLPPMTESEKELNRSMAYSRYLGGMDQTKGDLAMMFIKLKICTPCNDLRRLGGTGDRSSGSLTCMDNITEDPTSKIRAIYSIGGDGNRDNWAEAFSMAAQGLGHQIYQFDCNGDSLGDSCKDCVHYKKCVEDAPQIFNDTWYDENETRVNVMTTPIKNNGLVMNDALRLRAVEGQPTVTLAEILNMTGQSDAPRASLIMRMDVHGAEWTLLNSRAVDLFKFKQLIVRFHFVDEFEFFYFYMHVWERMKVDGFRVAAVKDSKFYGYTRLVVEDGELDAKDQNFIVKDMRVPRVVEVTFLLDTLEECDSYVELEWLKADLEAQAKAAAEANATAAAAAAAANATANSTAAAEPQDPEG